MTMLCQWGELEQRARLAMLCACTRLCKLGGRRRDNLGGALFLRDERGLVECGRAGRRSGRGDARGLLMSRRRRGGGGWAPSLADVWLPALGDDAAPLPREGAGNGNGLPAALQAARREGGDGWEGLACLGPA